MNAHITPSPGTQLATGQWQPTKVMHWYDGIIDVMFANPGIQQKELAALLGKHPRTISLVINSDLFKARYALRRQQFDQSLHERLAAKMSGVAEKSLDLTLKVLEKKQDAVPLEQLVDINSKMLGMLGYGPTPSAGTNINLHMNQQNNGTAAVSASDLARARDGLREREKSLMIDGSAVEIGASSSNERGEG